MFLNRFTSSRVVLILVFVSSTYGVVCVLALSLSSSSYDGSFHSVEVGTTGGTGVVSSQQFF